MIKDSPNPPSDSTAFHTAAHRAINHYLNPSENQSHLLRIMVCLPYVKD